MSDGQQCRTCAGASPSTGDFVFFIFLQNAVRNRSVDRQAKLLDGFGTFQPSVQRLAYQHQGHRQEAAKNSGDQYNQGLFRFDRFEEIDIRGIDQAHITDGARAHHIQFLRLVQQLGINGGTDLYIPGQAQQFLLSGGEAFHLGRQTFLLATQLTDLAQQCAIGRMLAGEFAVHLGLLQFQL